MYIDAYSEYGVVRYYNNDEHMIEQAFNQKIFEEEYIIDHLSHYISDSKFILDIGAHVGSHSVIYKKLNPDAIVFAFEPQKQLYKLLTFNIANNNLDGVYSYNCAISNYVGRANMMPYSSDGSNSGEQIQYGGDRVFNLAGLSLGAGGESVQVVSIDSLKFTGCDFIKIDVEGYEPHVLVGALATISSFSPVISFEYNEKMNYDLGMSSFDVLDKLGYTYYNAWQDNWIAYKR
jgi:FkbM family methyltransferase